MFWIYGDEYSHVQSGIIYTGARILWALFSAWTIGACVTGYGGLINWMLSWKALVPLSRLSYSVFLTHVWSIWIFMGSQRHNLDTSRYSMVRVMFISRKISLNTSYFLFHQSLLFLAHLFWSYSFGFIFMVIFESPILFWQKKLFKSLRLGFVKEMNQNSNKNPRVEILLKIQD